MERLTDVKDDLAYLVHFLNQQSNFDGNKVKAIHDSLLAYEDTGLTPEEINRRSELINSISKASHDTVQQLQLERDQLKMALKLASAELWEHCVFVSPEYFIQKAKEESNAEH